MPGESQEPKKKSRIRLATDEDLLCAFGPGRLLIGIPVRPPKEEPEPPSEEDEQSDDA